MGKFAKVAISWATTVASMDADLLPRCCLAFTCVQEGHRAQAGSRVHIATRELW
jgi:hypothetical protein